MQLFLEGKTVNLRATKNTYSKDIVISTDVAIFPTRKSLIKHRGPYSVIDVRMDMMADRGKNYEFRHQFSPQEQKPASLPKMFCKISIL